MKPTQGLEPGGRGGKPLVFSKEFDTVVRLVRKANGSLTLREILDLAAGYRLEDVVVGIETEQGIQDNTIGAVLLTVTATNELGGLKCQS